MLPRPLAHIRTCIIVIIRPRINNNFELLEMDLKLDVMYPHQFRLTRREPAEVARIDAAVRAVVGLCERTVEITLAA